MPRYQEVLTLVPDLYLYNQCSNWAATWDHLDISESAACVSPPEIPVIGKGYDRALGFLKVL